MLFKKVGGTPGHRRNDIGMSSADDTIDVRATMAVNESSKADATLHGWAGSLKRQAFEAGLASEESSRFRHVNSDEDAERANDNINSIENEVARHIIDDRSSRMDDDSIKIPSRKQRKHKSKSAFGNQVSLVHLK